MAELLVKLDPKLYRKYVQTENGKQELYVELIISPDEKSRPAVAASVEVRYNLY